MENEIKWWRVKRVGTHAVLNIFEQVGTVENALELGEALNGAETVDLWIDSPGGNAPAGIKVHELLAGRCTVATVTNRCFSAATTILMAAKTIRCYPDARLMFHSATTSCMGNAEDLRLAADSLEPVNEVHAACVSKRTGLPIETVRGWNTGGDHYFDAEQAQALGLVDEIIDRPETPAEVATVADAGDDAPATAKTESEKLFLDFLRAFGRVQVADKEKFTRELSAWLACEVNETICE